MHMIRVPPIGVPPDDGNQRVIQNKVRNELPVRYHVLASALLCAGLLAAAPAQAQ